MRVLVTGASGFIGGVACTSLAHRGHEVLALVRRPGSEPLGTVAVRADLTDGAGLRSAIAGAAPQAVLHCAAENGAQRDAGRLRAANVDGLRHLIDACAALPAPPQFVFVSTVVTGDAHGRLMTEESRLVVETEYGRSKQEGERMLLASGLPVSIIRPCHVYGPGGWLASEMIPLLRRPGRFAVIGSGENLWDVVHVDDVACACALALESAGPGEIFHCADDVPTTYREFMTRVAAALGTGPPRSLPVWIARIAAGSGPVATVVRSGRTSNAKLKTELGWRPRYPDSREGIPAAVAALAA
ncbi:MAG TPA: NAD(P)-dependent oxidoreductase [Solirubrobacteraceae bacterium]|nr:NAD(P)-dependent oxidoreductase [Solirubrobacteraceae bacterium]